MLRRACKPASRATTDLSSRAGAAKRSPISSSLHQSQQPHAGGSHQAGRMPFAFACNESFNEHTYDILRFGSRRSNYGGAAAFARSIMDDVGVVAVVEQGPRSGALRAHVHFNLAYCWWQIQLDVKQLQVHFKCC
mmetsp:Transcript_11769/g.40239  ORF Transcript_11769/g.40239 Transcript_11769/m.40239 type:complete len:135 (+) Transcript_11769:376-780(+)